MTSTRTAALEPERVGQGGDGVDCQPGKEVVWAGEMQIRREGRDGVGDEKGKEDGDGEEEDDDKDTCDGGEVS